jgi:Tfp pilus assembly protein PilF
MPVAVTWLLVAWAASCAGAAERSSYRLNGRLDPPVRASVSIWGYTTPFGDRAVSDFNGRFRFKNLRQGTYTVAVFIQGQGEARRTVEVGPGVAKPDGAVDLTLKFADSDFVFQDAVRRKFAVPAQELKIPDKARREFEEALKDLARHRGPEAVAHLESAVQLAPRFALAWNDLGTIAYRNRNYLRAEECFRNSLAADPTAFEPLVNLGGVLVSLNKPGEAIEYNLAAVLRRPNDALANSQLGMTYFQLKKLDLAAKYLEAARRIDPGHFSHPQILLADILVHDGKRRDAAGVLDEFLRFHPDYPRAEQIRIAIKRLRE